MWQWVATALSHQAFGLLHMPGPKLFGSMPMHDSHQKRTPSTRTINADSGAPITTCCLATSFAKDFAFSFGVPFLRSLCKVLVYALHFLLLNFSLSDMSTFLVFSGVVHRAFLLATPGHLACFWSWWWLSCPFPFLLQLPAQPLVQACAF